MKKILTYAGKNKKYLIWAIICLLISTILGIIPYYFLNNIILNFLGETAIISNLLTLVLLIAGAFILKAVFYGIGLGLSHIGAFNTLFNMRNTFAKDMAHQPMGHIMEEGTGKYKKTFVEDISQLESALAHMIPEGVPYIFTTILTLIAIFITDYRLGIAFIITIPITMLPMVYMMKVGLSKMPEYYGSRDKLNHTLIEYVSAMEVIKIFNKTTTSFKQLQDDVISSRDFTVDWCKVTWKSTAVLYALLPCTLLLVFPTGLFLFANGNIGIGALTLATMLCLSLSEPLIKVIGFMPSIPILSYGINKIEKVFKYPDVKNGEFDKMSDNLDVEFKNVTFGYNEKDVIKDISFKIPQNSICALVGTSGSGKSTIAKLLMHFWDVKDGEIKIGNKNICEFTFENLMNHISYVSQENTLFEATIFENIAVARENITKEEVIEACKQAKCHDFIMKLPNGYDTNVGTLGTKLSGGERQRITIARAIIKNSPIIVLDEATAFADAENEFLIQEALSKLFIGKTVFVIAHKLHTITDVDKIILVHDGEIQNAGTHEELLKESAIYQKLWEKNQQSIEWNIGGVK